MRKLKRALFSTATMLVQGNPKQALVLASVGRSGTTWLGNILSALDGYKMLNEPLRPERSSEYAAGHRHRPYVGVDDEAPALHDTLARAFRGQIPQSYKWDFEATGAVGRLMEHLTNRNVVVKSTRCLRILPWLHKHFDLRGTVILIRHPCAVISSMLESGGWGYERLEERGISPFNQAVGSQAPESVVDEFREEIEAADTNPQILAHMWALDYHLALRYHKRTGGEHTHLVRYEDLVIQGEQTVGNMCSYLDTVPNSKMLDYLDRPSRTAAGDVSTKNASAQLRKWKDHLDDQTIKNILSIVKKYEVEMYDTGVMPTN